MSLIQERNLVDKVSKKLLMLTDEYWNKRNSMTRYQFENFLTEFTRLDNCRYAGMDYEGEGILFSIEDSVLFAEIVEDVSEHTEKKLVKNLFFTKAKEERCFVVHVRENKEKKYSLSSFRTEWDSEVAGLKKGDMILVYGSVRARVYGDHVYYSACEHLACKKI